MVIKKNKKLIDLLKVTAILWLYKPKKLNKQVRLKKIGKGL